jgi:predicted transcriptional regulator
MATTRQAPIKRTAVPTSVALDPDQLEKLDLIVKHRRTHRSVLLREAVDLFLAVNSRDAAIIGATTPDQEATSAA